MRRDREIGNEARDLEHSRPLDVHTWSDHPEVNEFVTYIWQVHFEGAFDDDTGRPGRRARARPKDQLKVLLLDLYVAWAQDPALSVGVAMSPTAYQPNSRYNAIHISRLMPELVHHAQNVGLIGLQRGDQRLRRVTRIWPTETLVSLFQQARFGILDVGDFPDRECIMLSARLPKWMEKDEQVEAGRSSGGFEPYSDTPEIVRMRENLRSYNQLLHGTFIDIPVLDHPRIMRDSEIPGSTPTIIQLDQTGKYVRRVFYRKRWDLGGRYHGGFWQALNKEWRKRLWINDLPVIEDDYSGFHIALLYGLEGKAMKPKPYVLEGFKTGYDKKAFEAWVKSLALMALNARNERAAFGAFRRDQPKGSPAKKFTNDELKMMLDAFKEKHPAIAHHMCTDVGVELMAIDGRITTRIIDHFTAKGVPVLTIYDSYVIDVFNALELRREMVKAVRSELPAAVVNIKRLGHKQEKVEQIKGIGRYRYKGILDQLRSRHSDGYRYRKAQFEQWTGRRL